MNRRHVIAAFPLTSVVTLLASCAQPSTIVRPPPRFSWFETATFQSMEFIFWSAKFSDRFYNFVNQPTLGGNFLILAVKITNKSNAPVPFEFQPNFHLIDESGALYDSNLQHSLAINLGKPGRLPVAQTMNPNVLYTQELVFEVPKAPFTLRVLLPNRAQLGFGGSVTASGPYFLVDMSSELTR